MEASLTHVTTEGYCIFVPITIKKRWQHANREKASGTQEDEGHTEWPWDYWKGEDGHLQTLHWRFLCGKKIILKHRKNKMKNYNKSMSIGVSDTISVDGCEQQSRAGCWRCSRWKTWGRQRQRRTWQWGSDLISTLYPLQPFTHSINNAWSLVSTAIINPLLL